MLYPRNLLLPTLLYLTLSLGGCGGAGSQTPSTDDMGGAGVSPVIGSAALRGGDSAYPAFPGEADGPYSAVRAVSDSVLVVNGNALVEEHGVNNKQGEGNAYVIAPGGDDDLAWARYSIEGLTVERPVDISIGVTGVIAPGGDDDLPISYWLGLSDYTNYRWEWRGDPEDAQGGPYTAPAEIVLNSEEVRERYVSAAGVFHFVILTESSGIEPDESNPEGITAVEIIASTIAAIDAGSLEYNPTTPHYVPIQSISVGGGGGGGKGASALDPDTQYVTITWEHVQDFEHPNGEAFIYQVARQGPEDQGKVQLRSFNAPRNFYVDPINTEETMPPIPDVIPGATYRYFVRGANPQWGWTPFATSDTVTIPLLAAH